MVSYRGNDNKLFRDFGKILGKYPDLKLIDYGFFGQWMITQEVVMQIGSFLNNLLLFYLI